MRGRRFGNHHVRVATVGGRAGNRLLEAMNEDTPAALRALPAVTAEVAHTDTLTDAPSRDPLAYGVDPPNDFMTGYPRECQIWKQAFDRDDIGVADPAGLHADADFPRTGARGAAARRARASRVP